MSGASRYGALPVPEELTKYASRAHETSRVVIETSEAAALAILLWDKPASRSQGCRRRRGAPKDGVPPPHSITSSARASRACESVRPSAFAVLRFSTSSKAVGCSTGKSAGLTPFSILSTK